MTRSRGPRDGAGPRDARRSTLIPAGLPLAAVLSVVGLLVVGVATYALGTGDIPLPGSNGGPGATSNPGILQSPTPSGEVIVPTAPPTAEVKRVPGTLLYVKDGNVWLQTDGAAQQLTQGGADSMATFSPDGQTVYFIRTRRMDGLWPVNGVARAFRMAVPALMSIPTKGGRASVVLDGLVNPPGSYKWMAFVRDPAVSPDGRYIAIATELPDPTRSDVVIKLYDTRRKTIIDPKLSEVTPLGQQDPAWRPDGKKLVYVRSDRDGAKGTPRLYLYDVASGTAKALTGPAYLHPSYSPDGAYIAATKTSAFGTDVVILSASTGAEVAQLTTDGDSWAPVWSPAGDQIAYLHVSGQIVDLRLLQLDGTGPTWTVKDPINLTLNAGLDGASRPGWFVPADQLPAPSAAPASGSGSPAASPSG